MIESKLAVVAGMGKGLGTALASFFSSKGYQVIGLNRSLNDDVQDKILQIIVDLSNENQVNEIVDTISQNHGVPNVLIHNAAELYIGAFEDTSSEQFEQCWRSNALSAFIVAKGFLPKMTVHGGTAIFTGATASIRIGAKFSAFSASKFALRGLVQSLARQYQTDGIHVVHSLIDGIIDTEKSRELHSLSDSRMLNPLAIAESYWLLTQQNQSAWTHEFDLRPHSESF